MLSHKSKYALKALLVLSEEYGNGPLLIAEIAEREHIPKRFLELILLELKNQGVLRSKKGKGGGYILSKPPDLLSVGAVAAEETLAVELHRITAVLAAHHAVTGDSRNDLGRDATLVGHQAKAFACGLEVAIVHCRQSLQMA